MSVEDGKYSEGSKELPKSSRRGSWQTGRLISTANRVAGACHRQAIAEQKHSKGSFPRHVMVDKTE